LLFLTKSEAPLPCLAVRPRRKAIRNAPAAQLRQDEYPADLIEGEGPCVRSRLADAATSFLETGGDDEFEGEVAREKGSAGLLVEASERGDNLLHFVGGL